MIEVPVSKPTLLLGPFWPFYACENHLRRPHASSVAPAQFSEVGNFMRSKGTVCVSEANTIHG